MIHIIIEWSSTFLNLHYFKKFQGKLTPHTSHFTPFHNTTHYTPKTPGSPGSLNPPSYRFSILEKWQMLADVVWHYKTKYVQQNEEVSN